MYIQSNHLSDTAEAYGDYNVAERENITVNSFPQQKPKMWVRLVPTYLPYLLPVCVPYLPTYRHSFVLMYVPTCLPIYLHCYYPGLLLQWSY